jgi:hypothetical protein
MTEDELTLREAAQAIEERREEPKNSVEFIDPDRPERGPAPDPEAVLDSVAKMIMETATSQEMAEEIVNGLALLPAEAAKKSVKGALPSIRCEAPSRWAVVAMLRSLTRRFPPF